MKKFMKNYKQSLILLLGIVVGAIVGLIFKDKATVLSPLGDIFINMMYVIIVPLIFTTVSLSIAKMESPKRLGKILLCTLGIFAITSVIAVLVGVLTTYNFNLVESTNAITNVMEETETESVNILESTANLLTVGSFGALFERGNIIALLIVSIIFGISVNMAKEKGQKVKEGLDSLNTIIMNFIKIIMYYAPIGLGCYFAALVGTIGASIATGFLKVFVIYLIVSILYFAIVYSIYAYLAYGKKGVKLYWKNVFPAFVTSVSTCSSAASIPVNAECARKIGVSEDIAETVIPLGTSFHKDGSIIGSVFKIMFLVYLFNTNVFYVGGVFKVLGIALIATLLVTAVPIGGGTISEALIIKLMGYSTSCLPILTIIATVIDAPATMLNVVGDTASSMMVARLVDGKDWPNKKESKKVNKKKVK